MTDVNSKAGALTSPVYGHHTGWMLSSMPTGTGGAVMYPVGFSHPPRERTVNWKTRLCVVMFAGGWFALTVTSAVSAQEAVDQNKRCRGGPHPNAPRGSGTAQSRRGSGGHGRSRSRRQRAPDTAINRCRGTRWIERDARIVTIKPESPQVEQVCRKISVTGTRFTRRECRTAEQWAEVDAQRSATGGASCATFKDSRPP